MQICMPEHTRVREVVRACIMLQFQTFSSIHSRGPQLLVHLFTSCTPNFRIQSKKSASARLHNTSLHSSGSFLSTTLSEAYKGTPFISHCCSTCQHDRTVLMQLVNLFPALQLPGTRPKNSPGNGVELILLATIKRLLGLDDDGCDCKRNNRSSGFRAHLAGIDVHMARVCDMRLQAVNGPLPLHSDTTLNAVEPTLNTPQPTLHNGGLDSTRMST
jgi:hypothetical protein